MTEAELEEIKAAIRYAAEGHPADTERGRQLCSILENLYNLAQDQARLADGLW